MALHAPVATGCAASAAQPRRTRSVVAHRCALLARPVHAAPAARRRRVALSPRAAAATDAPSAPPATSASSPLETLSALSQTLQGLVASPVRAQYAAAQGLRFAYFLTQDVVNSRFVLRNNIDAVAIARTVAQVLTSSSSSEPLTGSDLLGRPLSAEESVRMSAFWQENIAAVLGVFRAELAQLEAGTYKLPYDLSPLAPRQQGGSATSAAELPALGPQWNPVAVLRTAALYMADQAEVARRRAAKAGQELLSGYESAPGRYPAYYLQNFHFQTDGWLSSKSAELYDYQVECLFLGCADAMRRAALPHVSAFLAERRAQAPGAPPLRLLDAATGTGRFLSFVLDNWGAELDATALDLSPFYLQKAKRTLAPWAGPRLRFLEANVESIPRPDASFDAITCVYLFHELPPAARKAAAAEFGRLLTPGGRLFFVDSAQQGDGERNGMPVANDMALEGFPRFNHEPYYTDYTRTQLAELFAQEAGLTCVAEEVAWVTKVLVFEKAAAAGAQPPPPPPPPEAAAPVTHDAAATATATLADAAAPSPLGEPLQ